jgi:hypothetical protein
MYRTFTVLTILTVFARSLLAQPLPLGNEWINYNQTYFKLPIAETGLYRISASELERAGFPIKTVNPTTIQLFHRGVEQAIFVEGESDRRFDIADFLEFYGRGNDGTQDSLLYRPVSAQPHSYYSLFSDTTAYFLTWRFDGKPGKRMPGYSDLDYASLPPEPYHWAEELRLFTDNYPGYAAGIPPKIEFSHYEAGEGYTGVIRQKDKPYSNTFSLSHPYTKGPIPQLDVLLVGRDYTKHRVECQVGPTTDSQRSLGFIAMSAYDNARAQLPITWTDIVDNQLKLATLSRGDNSDSDRYSVSYLKLRYPQLFVFDGKAQQTFQLAINQTGRTRLDISGTPTITPRFWDITDPTNPIRLGASVLPSGMAQLIVRGTDISRTVFSTSQPKSVASIRPVAFADWRSRKPTYLIISHEALTVSNVVQTYARYRASAAGGSHDTLTTTLQQLFDQFSYGERHPLAIRRFADQMLRQGSPQYLLLIGRSRSTSGIRRHPEQAALDMVMTAGFPGSDIVFTAGLAGQPQDVPAIPTGRINASTPQEVINYLNKVKEYEIQPNALWRKRFLHLSGGETADEAAEFGSLMDVYKHKAIDASLGAHVTTLTKQTDNLVETINVVKPVNEGVGLMTFFGHSGLDVTDLDIGFCTNDALGYQNKGRYPLLLINGCAIGNFFFGRPTLATDWVLAPERGAIAAIANSHLGNINELHQYSTIFYNLLADSTQLNRSIGQIQQETIRQVLAQNPDGLSLANCQQMVLQGDPAIRPFPFETPDYAVSSNNLTVTDSNELPLTTLSDSVQIRFVVQNVGQYRKSPLPVRVRRFVNNQEVGVFNLTLAHEVAYLDTLTLTIPNQSDAEGPNQFELTINPIGTIRETNQANNRAWAEVSIPGQKPTLLYPASGSVLKTTAVQLSADFAKEGQYAFDLELDTTARFDSPFRLTKRITATHFISYQANLLNSLNTTYHWRVRLAGSNGGASQTDDKSWATGSFIYAPLSTSSGLPEGHAQLAVPLPTDIQQGDTISVSVQFVNLSPYAFTDSVMVQQTIFAANLSEPETTQWRMKAPAPGDQIDFVTHIATANLPGLNRVVLTINPHLQPEYSFANNTLNIPLVVQPDRFGPALEVAIDGARISDGATVSARPVLDILLADDNRSLVRRDTSGMNLFLQRPGTNSPFERLSWRRALIQPTGSDNVFRVRYPSPTLSEGLYHVRVTARDAVGNVAVPYQVSFRVVNESKLTSLSVYPNPFRERVLFAFQLIGAQAPDALSITISSLNGQPVRHLRKPARIGLNEWQWDGLADSGEPLPAGVYLYKLTIGNEDQPWLVASDVKKPLSGRLLLVR